MRKKNNANIGIHWRESSENRDYDSRDDKKKSKKTTNKSTEREKKSMITHR